MSARASMVTMSPKSSLLQPANSVSQALIPDSSVELIRAPAVRRFARYSAPWGRASLTAQSLRCVLQIIPLAWHSSEPFIGCQ